MASGRGCRPGGYSDSDSDDDDGYVGAASTSLRKTEVARPLPSSSHNVTWQKNPYQVQDQRNEFNYHGSRHPNFSSNNHVSSGTNETRAPGRRQVILSKIPGFQEGADKEWAVSISNKIRSSWEVVDETGGHVKFPKMLNDAFETCEQQSKNLFAFGLFLTLNSPDFAALQGKSQALAVITALKNYLGDRKRSINKEIQHLAFEGAVSQKKQNLIEAIFDVFNLADPDRRMDFVPTIEKMCFENNFKEACLCAMYLKLHNHFDIHSFLIPLLLQDRFNVVEEYLKDTPDIQINIVRFLDSCFDYGSAGVSGTLFAYVNQRNIGGVKPEKLNPKPITKLVRRLASKFKIGNEHCPNVGNRQRFGELRHLFSRRYEKQDMNVESFDELINQIADGNQKSKDDIISHFMMYGDYEATARFVVTHELFDDPVCRHVGILPLLPEPHKSRLLQNVQRNQNVDDECWEEHNETSQQVVSAHVGVNNYSNPQEDESWETSSESVGSCVVVESKKIFYLYPLPRETIHMVGEVPKLMDFCRQINEMAAAVEGEDLLISGFDSEWKPIMSKLKGAALLQIAFESDTFIIDIMSLKLNSTDDRTHWTALRKDYFENQRIMKLGFDVRNDVKMLIDTVPEWQEMNQTWKSLVDFSNLKSVIMKEDPSFFEKSAEGDESGLSELVYRCLGKSLSKAEQMSDWEKRPMRESQLLYAAGDAYCLIEVYKSLRDRTVECRADLAKFIKSSLKGSSSTTASKKRKAPSEIVFDLVLKMQNEVDNPIPVENNMEEANDPSSIKLVCDNMFQGLGRHLRAIGFNTVILDNSQPHSKCSYHAMFGRHVITKGVAFNEIIHSLPENRAFLVYHVKCEMIVDQLQEICSHFGIALSPKELFTICQRCNKKEFIQVSTETMLKFIDYVGSRFSKSKSMNGLLTFKDKIPDDMILSSQSANRTWELINERTIRFGNDGRSVVTPAGIPIEVQRVPPGLTHLINSYYVCSGCGKCYWESTSLEQRMKKSLNEESNLEESQISIKTEQI
ncbi:Exonuclease mut-7 [Orchesella cincta]|uniref:Exonuclease mut-7 n=1 Tax=Orchesella cincta TaxID=48709 RepID=A0A1D2NDI1_ORCCI|nr:Exonuclease mut-7 [Orchesella cincta]